MTENTEAMPYNKVGGNAAEDISQVAQREGLTEAEWRARNLPAGKIEFRWRYTNKAIPLYERRLRSLSAFNVGPAVQAWVRSRLEWVVDNRLYEMPDGVLVLSIDPEGAVDIKQEPNTPVPAFTAEMLEAGDIPGTLWLSKGAKLYIDEPTKHASDTFVRDLANTLGYELVVGDMPDDAVEAFAVSDEYGVIPCEGRAAQVTAKLCECFDKLWTLKK